MKIIKNPPPAKQQAGDGYSASSFNAFSKFSNAFQQQNKTSGSMDTLYVWERVFIRLHNRLGKHIRQALELFSLKFTPIPPCPDVTIPRLNAACVQYIANIVYTIISRNANDSITVYRDIRLIIFIYIDYLIPLYCNFGPGDYSGAETVCCITDREGKSRHRDRGGMSPTGRIGRYLR